MAGKRLNLADLAGTGPLPDARVPFSGDVTQRSARLAQVAPNPLNRRDVASQRDKVEALAASIREIGQLQPCAVVTRDAFLAAFPEERAAIGDATFVQVTGARRRAAIAWLELPTIEITVKNSLADSPVRFLSATMAENIEREDYNPIEEAQAVHDLVKACGTGKAAAEQLARTPAWVTQRQNLLKLVPEVQEAIRSGALPLREVRDWHKRSPEGQLSGLAEWRAVAESRKQADELRQHGDTDAPDTTSEAGDRGGAKARSPRRTPFAAAVRRLGGTPVKIAAALRSELSVDDRRALAEELLRDEVE